MKKIQFNKTELVVLDCYAVQIAENRIALKIKAEEKDVSNDIVKKLKENKEKIELYEEDELKSSYEHFNEDFSFSYKDSIYDIELTRKSELSIETEKNVVNIEELNNTVHLLIDDVIPDLLSQIELLKGGEEDGGDNSSENHTSEESIVGKSEE